MADDDRRENGDYTPTVFIVDDESMVTSALEAFLGLETSYRVETFNTPHEALAQLIESLVALQSVDLVGELLARPRLVDVGVEALPQLARELSGAPSQVLGQHLFLGGVEFAVVLGELLLGLDPGLRHVVRPLI